MKFSGRYGFALHSSLLNDIATLAPKRFRRDNPLNIDQLAGKLYKVVVK
jgi:hypothetical protein